MIKELIEAAQSVIDSIDPKVLKSNNAVTSETTYTVNAHSIWHLGTAIAVIRGHISDTDTKEAVDRCLNKMAQGIQAGKNWEKSITEKPEL